MKNVTPVNQNILLSRYALKDIARNVSVGSVVCVPGKGLGRVKSYEGDVCEIELSGGEIVNLHKREFDLPTETSEDQVWRRVAAAVAETDEQEFDFYNLMHSHMFIPGGRILAAAGGDVKLSLYNCVSGETLIHTKNGLRRADSLTGAVEILSQDGVFRKSTWGSYGRQQLWEINLKNGDVLYATEGHEWIVGDINNRKTATTSQLRGMTIPLQHQTFTVSLEDPEFRLGVQHGMVYGDGTTQSYDTKSGRVSMCLVPAFTQPKKDLLSKVFDNVTYQPSRNALVASNLPEIWKSLPSDEFSITYLRGFIAGLIATDGHVDSRGSAMVHQSNLYDLIAIRKIASSCGIPSTSLKMVREVNPFSGEYAPTYKIQFIKAPLYNSGMILLEPHKLNMENSPNPKKHSTMRVVDVCPTNRFEEVYCCNEPETHTMVIEAGYLTRQCFVIPSPDDSRDGIFDNIKIMANIMARGGGVGVNISTIRPKNAIVKGVNGVSSGSISWAELYSNTTGVIEQGGKRRGALMLIQEIWHPDILEFITAKTNGQRLTNCNMSVAISDLFMAALELDEMWDLEFPDTSDELYDMLWDGNLAQWKSNGHKTIVYKTLPARELWDLIATTAWASGEPGLWFIDRSNNDSNSFYYNRLVATNPCGEQSLSDFGVCNLAAINLAEFVVNGEFRYDLLETATYNAVIFLDNVVSLQPKIDIREDWYDKVIVNQENERRVGLSTMGLADAMAKCGIAYGNNEDCKLFIDNIYIVISESAYVQSMLLAEEKGPFAMWSPEMANSGYMAKHPSLQKYAKKGMRNVTLLTQQPTGTIGTMLNTSTGLEPFYAPYFERASRIGNMKELASICKDFEGVKLPDHFRFAMNLTSDMRKFFGGMSRKEAQQMEISPQDHIAVLGWVQYWIDSACSKTVNLPESATVEDVKLAYNMIYEVGAKGGTIYRDNSRYTQVLTTTKTPEEICPDCQGDNVIEEGGCVVCKDCAWSKCLI